MQVTINSSEPLRDALRVIGALYDVELAVAQPAVAPSSVVDAERSAVPEAAAIEEQAGVAALNGAARGRKATASTTPRRSLRASKTATANGSKNSAAPTTSQVRSWAQANGQRVSDRGRVSSAIMRAYEDAHQG